MIESVIKDIEPFKLTVRRRKLWTDTVQKLKRAFKEGISPLVIEFVGEEANDVGGPLKEYFSVAFEEAQRHLMCSGSNPGFHT